MFTSICFGAISVPWFVTTLLLISLDFSSAHPLSVGTFHCFILVVWTLSVIANSLSSITMYMLMTFHSSVLSVGISSINCILHIYAYVYWKKTHMYKCILQILCLQNQTYQIHSHFFVFKIITTILPVIQRGPTNQGI